MFEEQSENQLEFEDEDLKANMEFSVAENMQLVSGKIIVVPKQNICSFSMVIQIQGFYSVNLNQQINSKEHSEMTLNQTQNEILETVSQIEQDETKRVEKNNIIRKGKPDQNEAYQIFLDGKQRVTQPGSNTIFETSNPVLFPFTFSLPPGLPPSLQDVCFANKTIDIQYFIVCQSHSPENKKYSLKITFPITIQGKERAVKKSSQLCRSIQFQCFKRFFCGCMGSYHFQVVGTVLAAGKLQLEARFYRSDKKTQKLIEKLVIIVKSELKDVKTVEIGRRAISLQYNEFEMLSGEAILNYEGNLRSYSYNLFAIRFWIECEVEFGRSVWAITRKEAAWDLEL